MEDNNQNPSDNKSTDPITSDKVEEETIDMKDYIHRKIAANEVYNVLSKSNTMSWILLVALFLSCLLTQMNIYAGVGMVTVFSLMLGFLIFKNKQRMRYFEQEYDIKPDKIQID